MISTAVSVIGRGFVGGSLSRVLAERGARVFSYDKAKKHLGDDVGYEYCDYCDSIEEFVKFCERQKQRPNVYLESVRAKTWPDAKFLGIYFVCVPTPMHEDGSCDTSIVEGVLRELAAVSSESHRIAVIKSTVPPGTTENWNKLFADSSLRVVHNPEFLREATALEDMRNQDRIVLGGPRPHINVVNQFYESVFPNVPIIKTSSTTSEMVKYITNVHLAVKVSLANEFYQICNELDKRGFNIDFDKCTEYATIDPRLGKSHWKVPGPMPADDTGMPAFGYGGSCFCKDINALINVAKSIGVRPTVMQASWDKNVEVRPQRDWEKLVGRAVSKKDE